MGGFNVSVLVCGKDEQGDKQMKRTAVTKRNAHGSKTLQVFLEGIKSVLLGKYTRILHRRNPNENPAFRFHRQCTAHQIYP